MLQTKEEIVQWLAEMRIQNYTIQDDLTVDVHTRVHLEMKGLNEIPFQFGLINGSFFIFGNNLTSLKGCPTKITGHFDCSQNKLQSLEYCVAKVPGNFNCSFNNLKSLEYCPQTIGANFQFSYNQIENFEHAPKKVGIFRLSGNMIKNLNGFKIEIFDRFQHECVSLEDSLEPLREFYTVYKGSKKYKYIVQLSPKEFNAILLENKLQLEIPQNEIKAKRIKI